MFLTLLQFFATKFLFLALHLESGSFPRPLSPPNGQFNYSSVCGFSLAVNATAFAKFTFGIGR